MSDGSFDQNAWLERIGYAGPVTPTLETLNRLVFAHAHAISYETLDIMLRRPPKLDVASLQNKMIVSRRGGYCFEQNMSDQDIEQCIAVMKAKGTGDAPHPFFS